MKLGKGNACYKGQSKEATWFINHHASFRQITLRFILLSIDLVLNQSLELDLMLMVHSLQFEKRNS